MLMEMSNSNSDILLFTLEKVPGQSVRIHVYIMSFKQSYRSSIPSYLQIIVR